MAYYTALINGWNSVTQPPTGVSGTGLSTNDTTTQKLNKVNVWTVTGTIPTSFYVTGSQLVNCINWTEFAALTATQQANLLSLIQVQGPLLGGNSNTSFLVDGMVLAYFTNLSGPTITALTALANAQIQPWWSTSVANGGAGLTSAVSQPDLTAAGLS